jgi:Ca2+:H+ antiporter
LDGCPALSFGVLLVAGAVGVGVLLVVLSGAALLGTVIAAVHHAEVIAHRVGEPFGTLVLALAVTVIEASLILSMMIAGGDDMATLPRDTIYAATMIICNGVIGICFVVGGLAHREQTFRVEGAGAGMAALIAMSMPRSPTFTTTTSGGMYSTRAFCRQRIGGLGRVRFHPDGFHRDYFIRSRHRSAAHAEPPTRRKPG